MLSASTRPLCNPHRHQAVSLQLTTEAAEAWTIFSCFCGYGQNWTVWLLSRCFPILPGPQRSKRTLPRTPSPQTEKLQGLKASGLKAGKAQLSPSLFHFCTFLSNKYFWLNKGRKSPQLSSWVLSTFKVEAGGLLGVQGHPGPQSEILSKKIQPTSNSPLKCTQRAGVELSTKKIGLALSVLSRQHKSFQQNKKGDGKEQSSHVTARTVGTKQPEFAHLRILISSFSNRNTICSSSPSSQTGFSSCLSPS